MNYIKIIYALEMDIENHVNEYLAGLHKKGHRVMNVKTVFYELKQTSAPCVKMLFVINDEPRKK